MTVRRSEFETRDPELADDLVRQTYVDLGLSISKGPECFTFGHETVEVTGTNPLSINRLYQSATIRFEAEMPDAVLMTDAPRRGVVRVDDGAGFDGVTAGPGEPFLCPVGTILSQVEDADIVVTALSRGQVAEHAAARTGIDPGSLRFTGLAPIGPSAGTLWTNTVAHVRDDLLADPELATEPLILDSAHRLLASTLLATFPNTALDALNDPLEPGPGNVTADAADRAVDFARDHAGEPITPADVAARIGAPSGDIDAALRHRRNTTLALELWATRLAGAYRDLHAADPTAGDTVAAVAARWGFANPTTFRAAYIRASGGETPDATLRR